MKAQQLFSNNLAPVNGMLHFIAGDHENGITQMFQIPIASLTALADDEDLITECVKLIDTSITPLFAILIAPHFDENLLAYCEQLRNPKYNSMYALHYEEVGC